MQDVGGGEIMLTQNGDHQEARFSTLDENVRTCNESSRVSYTVYKINLSDLSLLDVPACPSFLQHAIC